MRKLTLGLGAVLLALAGCAPKEVTSLKIYVQQRNYDKAIEQGNKALVTNPNSGDTYYFLGAAYYGKDADLKPEAETYADSSEKFLKLAYQDFIKAKTLSPAAWGKSADDNIVSMFGRHFNRGVVASKNGHHSEAAVEYRLATLADPENYQGYYARAGSLMQLAKDEKVASDDAKRDQIYEAVLTDLNKVLELKPTERDVQVNTYVAKGEVLYKRKDTKGAQEAYGEAVKLDPENYDLMKTMGDRFYNEQDFENAEKYFEDSLAIQERLKLIGPDDYETYEALANARVKLSKRDEAIEAYQKALDLKPNDQDTMYNIMVTHYKVGEAAEKEAKMDEAKERYQQAIVIGNELIRLNPNEPKYWQVLGYCKRGIGDTAGAARDLKRYQDLRAQSAK